MFALLLSLIFVRPFISSLAFPYLDLLFSVSFLLVISAWIIHKGISFREIRLLRIPLLLFCLALLISTLFSQNKQNSLNELLKYASCISLFLIIASLIEEKKMLIIRTVVFAGFIISLLALYQYFFGFGHLVDYARKNNITDAFALDYIGRRRVFFPFVTPNILAGYLIMIIPLAAIDKNRRWFILPLSLALFLTKSVGAFISFFLALTLYFILHRRLKKKELLLLSGLLITVCLVIIARYASLKAHTQPLFSTIMRLNYWKETMDVIRAYPFSGVGIGNFSITLSRYAHNSYLQLWAEMGIFGVISLPWLILQHLRACRKPEESIPDAIFVSGLVFLIHNLVDFSFFLPEVAMIWWLVFGISLCRRC